MKKIISFLIISFSVLNSTNIKIGMSTALSGPAKELGINMYAGVKLAFDEENSKNKKNTYKILLSDDGYEPLKAAKNVRHLIKEEKVLAIIGNVGTPTANVTLPIIKENKILFFGAFSGASVLRERQGNNYVFNYRASYAQETASMINGLLTNGIKPKEIAFFTQNDSYGDEGYFGAISELKRRGFFNTYNLAHGRYDRNTLNIEEGYISILDSIVKPKAIIIVGSYKPVAKFIKLAKEDFPDALFLNVSFVGGNALKRELKGYTKNVIITQVVPIFNSNIPIVKEYNRNIRKFSKNLKPSFVSLEGYIIGRLFIEQINSLETKNIDSKTLLNSFRKMNSFDIGLNFKSSYNNKTHQYSNKIWTTKILNDKFVPFHWNEVKFHFKGKE